MLIESPDRNFILVQRDCLSAEFIDVRDIQYIRFEKSANVIVMKDKEITYYHDDLTDYLTNNFECFVEVRKGLVINVLKVMSFASFYKSLSFENGDKVDVTIQSIELLKKLLGIEMDTDKDMPLYK